MFLKMYHNRDRIADYSAYPPRRPGSRCKKSGQAVQFSRIRFLCIYVSLSVANLSFLCYACSLWPPLCYSQKKHNNTREQNIILLFMKFNFKLLNKKLLHNKLSGMANTLFVCCYIKIYPGFICFCF